MMMLNEPAHAHHHHHHPHHHHHHHANHGMHEVGGGNGSHAQMIQRSSNVDKRISPPVSMQQNNTNSNAHNNTNVIRPLSDLNENVPIHAGEQFGPIPNLFKWLHSQIVQIEQNLLSRSDPKEQINPNAAASSSGGGGVASTAAAAAATTTTTTAKSQEMDHQSIVSIAMCKKEQNMEIVYQQGQYYFEALHSFRLTTTSTKSVANGDNFSGGGGGGGETKTTTTTTMMMMMQAKAWLAKAIECKLVLKPGKSWLNGTEAYYCLMCNLFSPYSNLLLLHMILTCPKLTKNAIATDHYPCKSSSSPSLSPSLRQVQSSSPDANNNDPNHHHHVRSPPNNNNSKRRSFDIQSLLNSDKSQTQQQQQQQQRMEQVTTTIHHKMMFDDELKFDHVDGDDHHDSDSEEKIDVETLEDNTTHQPASGMLEYKSFAEFSRFSRQTTTAVVEAESSSYSVKPKSNGSRTNKASSKPKTNRQNLSKSAFKKLKTQFSSTSPESELVNFNQIQKINTEHLMPNLVPNLANLYSQFGPASTSLFVNTFANFFNTSSPTSATTSPPQLGLNHREPPPPPPQVSTQVSPSVTNHYPTNGLNNFGTQLSPTQQLCQLGPTTTSSTSKLYTSNRLSPKLSSPGSSGGRNGGSSTMATFMSRPTGSTSYVDMLTVAQNSLGPNSNSPDNSFLLSDSSTTSSSISPSIISLSPKSNNNVNVVSMESVSTTTNFHHSTKVSKEKSSSRNKNVQSPTSPITTSSSLLSNNSGGGGGGLGVSGNNLNLPPYFMPPNAGGGGSGGSSSSASTNPLISSMYLLSPSLTALSYQASNVCAYCNTAFRMTSDLVYHMRSHHKRTGRDEQDGGNGGNGGGSGDKKRRNNALRCNICDETFRERHHLTRHMTSHQ